MKLEILYINNTSILSAGGGGEERADEITKRLVENGHNVTFLMGKTAPDLPKHVSNQGRHLRHIRCVPDLIFTYQTLGFYLTRYLFAFASLPVLVSMLWRNEYDVVVETMTPYPTFAVLVTKLFDIPIVGTRHEFFDKSCFEVYDPVTATIQLVVQNFLRIFDYGALVVPSAHVRREFVEYGVPSEKIKVIPNGVNHQRYQLPDVEPEDGRLIVLGRLTKRKGQTQLVRTLQTVRDDGYDAQLDIVGDGPMRGQLEALVHKLDLDDHVTFHGFVNEEQKINLLNRAQLFVFASKQEGFGIVLLEAMATGLPVIAKHLPVYEEFFEDGKNGYLVREDNPPAFVDEVQCLIDDPELMYRMRRYNRETAVQYSWDSVADRTEEVLEMCQREQRAYNSPLRQTVR